MIEKKRNVKTQIYIQYFSFCCDLVDKSTHLSLEQTQTNNICTKMRLQFKNYVSKVKLLTL